VDYGNASLGWTADLSCIPGARWIWRGDVAPGAVADLQFAVFQKQFQLGRQPSGSIFVAADDFAEVIVNGQIAGTTGSVTDVGMASQAQSSLQGFDLGPYLVPGVNVLTIVGQNGPASFAGGACGPCTYADNAAGVVFGGVLASQ
jgi:hypothetical protein